MKKWSEHQLTSTTENGGGLVAPDGQVLTQKPLKSTHSRGSSQSLDHNPSQPWPLWSRPRSLRGKAKSAQRHKLFKPLPLAPFSLSMSMTKDLAIRIDLTLCRGVQLYPQSTISLAGWVSGHPCSFPKVSSLESATRPLQSFELTRSCPLRFHNPLLWSRNP